MGATERTWRALLAHSAYFYHYLTTYQRLSARRRLQSPGQPTDGTAGPGTRQCQNGGVSGWDRRRKGIWKWASMLNSGPNGSWWHQLPFGPESSPAAMLLVGLQHPRARKIAIFTRNARFLRRQQWTPVMWVCALQSGSGGL